MNEIASPMQLRLGFLRWALLFVPLVVLLGFGVSDFSGSGEDNRWFQALQKPEAQPPGWAFGAAWSVLYVMMGLAVTVVVTARGAKLRGLAVLLFFVQLALNLAWPIYFFGMHQVTGAFYLLVAVFVAAFATTIVFGRVRRISPGCALPRCSTSRSIRSTPMRKIWSCRAIPSGSSWPRPRPDLIKGACDWCRRNPHAMASQLNRGAMRLRWRLSCRTNPNLAAISQSSSTAWPEPLQA